LKQSVKSKLGKLKFQIIEILYFFFKSSTRRTNLWSEYLNDSDSVKVISRQIWWVSYELHFSYLFLSNLMFFLVFLILSQKLAALIPILTTVKNVCFKPLLFSRRVKISCRFQSRVTLKSLTIHIKEKLKLTAEERNLAYRLLVKTSFVDLMRKTCFYFHFEFFSLSKVCFKFCTFHLLNYNSWFFFTKLPPFWSLKKSHENVIFNQLYMATVNISLSI
jgi:hypothetical protein